MDTRDMQSILGFGLRCARTAAPDGTPEEVANAVLANMHRYSIGHQLQRMSLDEVIPVRDVNPDEPEWARRMDMDRYALRAALHLRRVGGS